MNLRSPVLWARQLFGRRRKPCPELDVAGVCQRLTAFSARTDREFTELAKGVSSILSRIRNLAAKSERLAAILEDRDEDRAISQAYEVYKQSVDLVHSSMGLALADHEQLEKVEARLLEACGTRAQLEQHSMVFRMVTVETRIEAMRLDHEGQLVFLNVGDAIEHMGRRINETAGAAFGRIEGVVAETRQERESLRNHQVSLHEEAQTSVGRIRMELDRLKDALKPCSAQGSAIVELVREIEGLANQAVVALQAQDIMRQQLEHVGTGLETLASHRTHAGVLRQASLVQRGQLDAARGRIETATANLREVLARLAQKGGDLAAHFVAMESAMVEAVGDCQLGKLFREETEKLTQIASQSEQSNQRISELVTRVDRVIKGFSEEVHAQQFDVTLVALNAQIAAARMSDAGALNRLAEETSVISAAVGTMTDSMTAQLREALETLRAMKDEADRFQTVIVKDKSALEVQSTRVNRLLSTLQGDLKRETETASHEYSEVQQTIAAFEQRLDWGGEVEDCFGSAAGVCLTALAWCGDEGVDREPVYRADAAGYTMASEYAVHAKALGVNDASPATTAGTESSGSSNGDNKDIELF